MSSDNKREFNRQLSSSHGSFELVLGPGFFALAGFFIDRKLGITPMLTVIGAVIGVVAVVVTMYYRYQTAMATHAQLAENAVGTHEEQRAA
ncbi:MAG TPA: hypothetical protein DEG43_08645 [Acidimicrobiaceae bacterium]|jgi:F0F1-type ATP synthase assembly protein I|nr:hypothetical protein [Acidimicrobiaceae bacterium]